MTLPKIIAVVFFLCSTVEISAQGFAWEWPPRSPKTMPTKFIGIEAGTGYVQNAADVNYSQNLIVCCTFTSGSGVPLRILVIGESWVAAKTAVSAGFGFTMSNSSFAAPGDTLPWKSTQAITEYAYDVTLSYITIEGGVRQRLFESYGSIGVFVRGQILASASESLFDKVISPDEYYFNGNPPTKEREITSNLQTSFSPFVLEAAITLQYDVPMGMGYYLAPSLTFAVPVTSVMSDATWRFLWTGFGFKLMRGI